MPQQNADDVSSSREQLVQANRLDAAREFTEAVLGGISGVIGLTGTARSPAEPGGL